MRMIRRGISLVVGTPEEREWIRRIRRYSRAKSNHSLPVPLYPPPADALTRKVARRLVKYCPDEISSIVRNGAYTHEQVQWVAEYAWERIRRTLHFVSDPDQKGLRPLLSFVLELHRSGEFRAYNSVSDLIRYLQRTLPQKREELELSALEPDETIAYRHILQQQEQILTHALLRDVELDVDAIEWFLAQRRSKSFGNLTHLLHQPNLPEDKLAEIVRENDYDIDTMKLVADLPGAYRDPSLRRNLVRYVVQHPGFRDHLIQVAPVQEYCEFAIESCSDLIRPIARGRLLDMITARPDVLSTLEEEQIFELIEAFWDLPSFLVEFLKSLPATPTSAMAKVLKHPSRDVRMHAVTNLQPGQRAPKEPDSPSTPTEPALSKHQTVKANRSISLR